MADAQTVRPGDDPRGILDLSRGLRRFELRRFPVQGRLAPWVEGFWQVSWDLGDGEEHLQSNISHASCNLVIEADGTWLYGVPDRVFTRRLSGCGAVFGVKFLPGGFYPFARTGLSGLRGRRVRIDEIWPEVPGDAGRAALESGGESGRIAALLDMLEPRIPESPARSTAAALRMAADPAGFGIAQSAAEFGLGLRALEKLFRAEIGIGPKEVLRRFRLQSAAARLAEPGAPSCGDLALELGYADQAHFIRDFKSVVGRPPMAYRGDQLGAASDEAGGTSARAGGSSSTPR